MAIREYNVNFSAWNRTQLEEQLNAALSLSGTKAYGNNTVISVEHASLTSGHDAAVNATLSAYVFDPTYGALSQDTNLHGIAATLDQWATDAAAAVAAWDGQTTAQRFAVVKVLLQRFGTMSARLSDLVKYAGAD
jgi:hypothetical protein